jgi:hypothetical protein
VRRKYCEYKNNNYYQQRQKIKRVCIIKYLSQSLSLSISLPYCFHLLYELPIFGGLGLKIKEEDDEEKLKGSN